jgi:hypothetical protein
MAGTSLALRRPVSEASLLVHDENGSITISEQQSVHVEINNKILWSADQTKAAWTKVGANTANIGGSDPLWSSWPVTYVYEDGTSGQHLIYQAGLTDTNSVDVVWSAYLKKIGFITSVRVLILQRDWSTTQYADVDLAGGTITGTGGSPTATSIEDVGNGWYRVAVVGSSGSGSNPCQAYVQIDGGASYLGDGASGFHMFGAQWQEGQTALDDLNLTMESSRIFDGFAYATTLEAMGNPPGRLWRVDAVDWAWRFDNPPAVVTKAYYGATDQEILLDAASESGLDTDITFSSSNVASLVSDVAIAFDGVTFREIVDKMAAASGAVWSIENRTFYYRLEASADAAPWQVVTTPSGPSQHPANAIKVLERHATPVNSVEVVGPVLENGRRPRATDSDATSISAYGTYARKFEFSEIATDGYAADVAAQIIASGKEPTRSISFEAQDIDGRAPITSVNQRFQVEFERLGVGAVSGPTYEDFISREVRISQQAYGVSRFAVTAGPLLPTLSDTMRRLELAARSRTTIPKAIGAIDFTASSSQSVDSGTSIANIDDMTDFSIFATVRCDDNASIRTIVAKENGSGQGWNLSITAFGLIQLTRTRASAGYSYSRLFPGGGFVAGSVYRIVCISDATAAPRFWINGVEATTGGGGSVGTGAFDSEASAPVRVGRDNGGAYMDGAIGAVVVWDLDLPETTALGLHNLSANALPFDSRIQLHWALDEFDDGSTALGTDSIVDRSANGYDGTPQNSPVGDVLVYIGV